MQVWNFVLTLIEILVVEYLKTLWALMTSHLTRTRSVLFNIWPCIFIYLIYRHNHVHKERNQLYMQCTVLFTCNYKASCLFQIFYMLFWNLILKKSFTSTVSSITTIGFSFFCLCDWQLCLLNKVFSIQMRQPILYDFVRCYFLKSYSEIQSLYQVVSCKRKRWLSGLCKGQSFGKFSL